MDFLDIPYAERHLVDDQSDLYAAMVAIERIEKAFHRDLITNDSYEALLRRLLAKYRSILAQLEQPRPEASSSMSSSQTGGGGGSFQIEAFWAEYGSKCSAARQRIRVGHPEEVKEREAAAAALASSHQAQQLQAKEAREKSFDPKVVLECGQHFITLMDCLKLQQTAVDQLFPILTDLVGSLRKFPNASMLLPAVLNKLETWVQRLSGMHPSDELNERDTRELAFDLERGYQTFYQLLSTHASGSGGGGSGGS